MNPVNCHLSKLTLSLFEKCSKELFPLPTTTKNAVDHDGQYNCAVSIEKHIELFI
jgi:hypothetical protein